MTEARVEPVVKSIGGITFTDPYAWLGEESSEAAEWQAQHVALAVTAAHDLPSYAALVDRIGPHLSSLSAGLFGRRKVAGRWFWLGANAEGTAQAVRTAANLADPGEVVLDAAELAAALGEPRGLMFTIVAPSPDGSLVAVAMGAGGEMAGVIRVAEVATGKLLDVEAQVLLFNSPQPGWLADGSGFFVQGRAPDGRHEMRFVPIRDGAPALGTATFELTDVPPTLPGLIPQVSPEGGHVVAVSVPHEHVVCMVGDTATGRWRRFLPEGFSGECHGDWLDETTYAAIVTDVGMGRVVAIPVATSADQSTWRELVPASHAVLRSLRVVGDRLVLGELVDVDLRIRVFGLDGSPAGQVAVPPHAASPDFVAPPRVVPRSDELVCSLSTFTQPSTTYRIDLDDRTMVALGQVGDEVPGISVQQRFATSADGTRVPYYIVARDDLDRSVPQPALVHAYGGFNVALVPAFLGHLVPFVESGGVYVHAILRGGSEYGRDWYDAGRGHAKQRTFDDLRAVAEDMIATGLSVPERMAFHGGSAGGLVAGVAIVQQPDLWQVVVPQVPLFDMMEPVADTPGADAVRSYFAEDYGLAENPADAAVLYAYSPYHNVVEGTAYPAVYQVFGEKDVGCHPFHGRKFTARLRAATSSGRPIHLRVWDGVGHGALDPQIQAQQQAEWMAFAMDQIGLRLRDS